MGWLIAGVILLAIWLFPLVVRVRYNSAGVRLLLFVGPFRISVYPRKNKKKTAEKQPKSAKEAQHTEKPGRLSDLKPILQSVLALLRDLRRKLVVTRLDVDVVMAGDDPCDLAINYGRAWSALGSVFPAFENVFDIKKRNIEIQCDFTADEMRIDARADIRITFGRLLCLLCKRGIPVIREFYKLNNQRKGGN